jgi:hypothetical protein
MIRRFLRSLAGLFRQPDHLAELQDAEFGRRRAKDDWLRDDEARQARPSSGLGMVGGGGNRSLSRCSAVYQPESPIERRSTCAGWSSTSF